MRIYKDKTGDYFSHDGIQSCSIGARVYFSSLEVLVLALDKHPELLTKRKFKSPYPNLDNCALISEFAYGSDLKFQ